MKSDEAIKAIREWSGKPDDAVDILLRHNYIIVNSIQTAQALHKHAERMTMPPMVFHNVDFQALYEQERLKNHNNAAMKKIFGRFYWKM